MINNLRQKQIKEILKENLTEKINDWNNLAKKAENLKYQDSIFFMKIYEELKKEKGFIYNENQLFNEALSLYDNSIRKIINFYILCSYAVAFHLLEINYGIAVVADGKFKIIIKQFNKLAALEPSQSVHHLDIILNVR